MAHESHTGSRRKPTTPPIKRPAKAAHRPECRAFRKCRHLVRRDGDGVAARAGEEIVVIDSGNSAGPAAVFLAHARRVYMLVRSDGLSETMPRYMIRRIEEEKKIELHPDRDHYHGGGNRLEPRSGPSGLHKNRGRSDARGLDVGSLAADAVAPLDSRRACWTSLPVSDVRAGNIKRAASSVGERAIAVDFVHQTLQE